jgi:hypothetical protein
VTTAALSSSTRIPSIDSQKSIPSVVASNVPEVSMFPIASSSITVEGGTRDQGCRGGDGDRARGEAA